jgi:hypothetical protein
MATIAALGALALLLSCRFLPRVFQEKSRWQQSQALEQVHRSWRYGRAQFRRAFAERFLDQWPFLWLLSRDLLPRVWALGLVSTVAVFTVLVPGLLQGRGRNESIA